MVRLFLNCLRRLPICLAVGSILMAGGCHAVQSQYELGPLLTKSTDCDCESSAGVDENGRPDGLPGRLCDRVQDNFINRKLAEHREAQSLPPWPRFHPLPARPAFYPAEKPEFDLQPEILGGFQTQR